MARSFGVGELSPIIQCKMVKSGEFFEVLFGGTADGAYPIIGEVFESGVWLDFTDRITLVRVVNVPAKGASVSFEIFHNN